MLNPHSIVVETDVRYFQAAARTYKVDDGCLSVQPGHLEGVVTFDNQPPETTDNLTSQINLLRPQLKLSHIRCYLLPKHNSAASVLARARFVERSELVFFGRPSSQGSGVVLREITEEAGWKEKELFHTVVPERPDGYPRPVTQWVAFERAKAHSLGMRMYTIRYDDEIAGVVGAFPHKGVIRAKNLVVRPDLRSMGIARGALAELSKINDGKPIGILAIAGGAGEKAYLGAGLECVGRWQEWSKYYDV